jgi:hypothetical protein
MDLSDNIVIAIPRLAMCAANGPASVEALAAASTDAYTQ